MYVDKEEISYFEYEVPYIENISLFNGNINALSS